MTRIARIVIPNQSHHIIQRGNRCEKALGSAKFINWIEGKFKVCFKVRAIGRPAKEK